jgi:hypothetical protein
VRCDRRPLIARLRQSAVDVQRYGAGGWVNPKQAKRWRPALVRRSAALRKGAGI